MTRVLKPLFDPKIRYADLGPVAIWVAPASAALTDTRDTAAGTATAFVWTDAAIVGFASKGQGNVGPPPAVGTVVLTLPNHNDGDLLVCHWATSGTPYETPADFGWTSVGSGFYTKVASSEPATLSMDRSNYWAMAYCWALQGSDNTAYDVGANTTSGPSYTFTGGGLILMAFRGYGDGSSAFNPYNTTDNNTNIGTPIGTYNFCGGHYGQVGGGAPTGQLYSGRISVASGGDNKQTNISIARFAQL